MSFFLRDMKIVSQNSINGVSNILYAFESRLCAYIAMTDENGGFNKKLTEIAEFLGTSYRHLLRTLDNLCNKGVTEKTLLRYVVKDDYAPLELTIIHARRK